MAAETPVRMGYALREKRIASFILPELVEHAKERGVDLVKINPDQPLEEQGPFDMILHKIDDLEWAKNLKGYSAAHPEVVVVDEFAAVHKLDDRREMLQAVDQLDTKKLGARVEVPKQIILEADTKISDIPAILEKENFKLPAVAKPVEANGTSSSHSLSLVLNKEALEHVELPVVLQEFVNHGGILFKLYLLGDKVMVFRRQSLPDVGTETEATEGAAAADDDKAKGIVQFNRISNVHKAESELVDDRVTDPPPELMKDLGLALRQHMQLQAFNVDILREGGHGDRYFVVDINYMPGYERIPDFPIFFIDFVLGRVEARRAAIAAKGPEAEKSALLKEELEEPVSAPVAPYPSLQGKKKWTYLKVAMKLQGLHKISRSGSTE